ncbi:LOW QUALITY PROTEIN: cytoplasmic tyrosine-protein kinase BMX [Amazona ochrocephala]
MFICSSNTMKKKTILEELLLKKPQQKKISLIKYKNILFVQTKTNLSCYEYDRKKGSKKGSTEIKKIWCAKTVNPEEATPPARQYPFQIVYKSGLLYVYATHEESREQWLADLHKEIKDNSDLLNKYRKGFFSNGKFLCCNQTCKADPGCTICQKCNMLFYYLFDFYFLSLQKWKHRSVPQVPSSDKSVLNMAVAQCNYEPKGNCTQLVRNNKCYVLDEDSYSRNTRDLEGQGKEGAFTVRKSSHASTYTASVRSKVPEEYPKNGTVEHYHVHKTPENKYYLTENLFESIPKLIHYHQHNSAGNPICSFYLICFGLRYFLALCQGLMQLTRCLVCCGAPSCAQRISCRLAPSRRHLPSPPEIEVDVATRMVTQLMQFLIEHQEELLGEEVAWLASKRDGEPSAPQMAPETAEKRWCLHLINCQRLITLVVDELSMISRCISSLGTRFPVKWSAPEVFHYTKFSSKSVVWAFSILMRGVTLGKQPYKLYYNMQVIEKVSQGCRLYRPQLIPDIIYQIVYNYWHELPEKHPAFYQLSFFEALREDNRA